MESIVVVVSCLVRYETLLQSETDNITKYYRVKQIILQNGTAMLLQNMTKVHYKTCQIYYSKMQRFYYKLLQLLENASTLLQNVSLYYQMSRSIFF